MTRIEPIEITAEQFRLLRALTVRCNGDAKAIFSTNANEDLWPPTRLGKRPITSGRKSEGARPSSTNLQNASDGIVKTEGESSSRKTAHIGKRARPSKHAKSSSLGGNGSASRLNDRGL